MNIHENLKAYLDNELTGSERLAVETALADDPALRKELQELEHLTGAIQELKTSAQPSGVERLMGRLESQPKSFPFWMKAVGAGVSVVLVLFVVGLIGQQLDRSRPVDAMATAGNVEVKMAQEDMAEQAPTRGLYGGSQATKSSPTIPIQPQTNTSQMPRLVIRDGSMTLKVESIDDTVTEILGLVKSLNGIMVSSTDSGLVTQRRASLTFRVPYLHFDQVMEELRKLGEESNVVTNSDDVTESVADIEARLKVMRAEEDQYITLLGKTSKIGEILQVKERLSMVRQQIESLEAQRKSLRSLAAYSTFKITLVELTSITETKESWFDETVASAVNALKATGQLLGKGIVYLVILAPIWLPIGFGIWWLARRRRI